MTETCHDIRRRSIRNIPKLSRSQNQHTSQTVCTTWFLTALTCAVWGWAWSKYFGQSQDSQMIQKLPNVAILGTKLYETHVELEGWASARPWPENNPSHPKLTASVRRRDWLRRLQRDLCFPFAASSPLSEEFPKANRDREWSRHPSAVMKKEKRESYYGKKVADRKIALPAALCICIHKHGKSIRTN